MRLGNIQNCTMSGTNSNKLELTPIQHAQIFMQSEGIDCWLLCISPNHNYIIEELLYTELPKLKQKVWIVVTPQSAPTVVAHSADSPNFNKLPLTVYSYSRYENVKQIISSIVQSCFSTKSPKIALDSAYNRDTALEFIGSYATVIPSESILNYSLSKLTTAQIDSHKFTAKKLTNIVNETLDFTGQNINWRLTEHDLSEFIKGQLNNMNLETQYAPIVAFNQNSTNPLYTPTTDTSATVRRNGWLLIDLCAKEKNANLNTKYPIYAKTTWVAMLGKTIHNNHIKQVFNVVKDARDTSFELINNAFKQQETITGWDVYLWMYRVIHDAGYSIYESGSPIGYQLGNTANFCRLKAYYKQTLQSGLLITISPYIDLNGIRIKLESSLHLSDRHAELTTLPQENLVSIET